MDIEKLRINLEVCRQGLPESREPFCSEGERRAAYLNANLLCSNIFVFKKPLDMEACHIPYRFDEIDWNRSKNTDEEWIFMLNRHEYLLDLVNVFTDSGEEKYLACWKRLVFDWIRRNPYEEGKLYTSWRTIDTGIRCSSWISSIIQLHPHLDDLEMEMITSSIREQAAFMKEHYLERYTLSNWGALQVAAIIQADLLRGEWIEDSITDWAWDELKRICEIQFYPDGVHWEQSPLYHFEVLFALFRVHSVAQAFGAGLPDYLEPVIRKAAAAGYYMIYPDGYLVPQHDSDYVYIQNVFDRISPLLPEEMPELFAGETSGSFIYKNGSDYVSIWNGRHGSGHGHASLGHINIFLNGERILCDSGRFTYQEMPIRNYLKSGESHSTVEISGRPATVIRDSWTFDALGKPAGNRVTATESYIAIESSFYHAGNLVQRTLIILKNEQAVIVIDGADSVGKHSMRRLFQLSPGSEAEKMPHGWKLAGKKNTAFAYFDDDRAVAANLNVASTLYNKLVNRTTLETAKRFENQGIAFSVFSAGRLEVKKNIIEQSESAGSVAEELFLSIRIKTAQSEYNVHFAANETFRGERVYKHRGDFFYHKLTVCRDGEVEVLF